MPRPALFVPPGEETEAPGISKLDDKSRMFEWNDDYRVGIDAVDRQHQEIFRIARELYEAMSQGRDKELLSRTFDRLIRYTATHFTAEEGLMRDSGYEALSNHIGLHRKLTQELLEFQREFIEGRRLLTLKVLSFLSDWLYDHIRCEDRRYVPAVQHSQGANGLLKCFET